MDLQIDEKEQKDRVEDERPQPWCWVPSTAQHRKDGFYRKDGLSEHCANLPGTPGKGGCRGGSQPNALIATKAHNYIRVF